MPGPYSLSESGVQTLTAGVTALSIVVTPGTFVEQGQANPVNYFHAGLLRAGSPSGYMRVVPIDAATQWLTLPVGCDRLGYQLFRGTTLVVTELFTASPAPGPVTSFNDTPDFISALSWNSIGVEIAASNATNVSGVTWYATNLAVLIPFRISDTFVCSAGWLVNSGTVSGHFDIGIYDHSLARIASTGSISQAGLDAVQAQSLTRTLAPGRYYMAIAFDNATGTIAASSLNAQRFRSFGCRQAASHFPLPTTFVDATYAHSTVPMFGLTTGHGP